MKTTTTSNDNKDNTACKRCGECCYYIHNGVRKKCKFLVKLKTTTYCRIYNQNNRLYRVLAVNNDGTKITCNLREDVNEGYEGCPLNNKNEVKNNEK